MTLLLLLFLYDYCCINTFLCRFMIIIVVLFMKFLRMFLICLCTWCIFRVHRPKFHSHQNPKSRNYYDCYYIIHIVCKWSQIESSEWCLRRFSCCVRQQRELCVLFFSPLFFRIEGKSRTKLVFSCLHESCTTMVFLSLSLSLFIPYPFFQIQLHHLKCVWITW